MPLLKLSDFVIYDTAAATRYTFSKAEGPEVKATTAASSGSCDVSEQWIEFHGAEAESLWSQLLGLCGEKAVNPEPASQGDIDELLAELDKTARDFAPDVLGLPVFDDEYGEIMRRAVRHFAAKVVRSN